MNAHLQYSLSWWLHFLGLAAAGVLIVVTVGVLWFVWSYYRIDRARKRIKTRQDADAMRKREAERQARQRLSGGHGFSPTLHTDAESGV